MSSLNDDGSLTPAALDRFQREGYLILPNFFDAEPILARARELIRGFDPARHPLTKFTTAREGDEAASADSAHIGDEYFLNSGDKIRWFLEEDAVKDGKLDREPEKSVNKVGHALHALDATFHRLTFSERVQNLVRSAKLHVDPCVLQSMIICKQPSIGGAVPPHNDSTFLYTSPPSAMGLWFALEPCRASAALSFQPGSHRYAKGEKPVALDEAARLRPRPDGREEELGVQRGTQQRFVRKADGKGTEFVTVAPGEEAQWDESKARLEECDPGTLVLIHGSVLHKSGRNTSDKSRIIYTFHCIERGAGEGAEAVYDERNWLQPTPEMSFSRLYAPDSALRTGAAENGTQ